MPLGSDAIARADRCGDRLAETALDSVLLADGPLQIGPHAGDTEFRLAGAPASATERCRRKATIASTSLAAHARSHTPAQRRAASVTSIGGRNLQR